MKHQARLQILEEIATKVAEMNVIGSSHLSDEIITKAFLLQTKKKQNDIIKQNKKPIRATAIKNIKANPIQVTPI